MVLNWNFAQLINYLSTWSAVKAYLSENKKNPIEIVQNKMLELWGNTETGKPVSWPLTVRVWQKS
jgi:hypothetical protein